MSFFLRGTYDFEGRKNPQVGIINISELEEITGYIMDTQSHILRHEIYGEFGHDKNKTPNLVFIKDPNNGLNIPVKYSLKKTDGKEAIEGTYEGFWEMTAKDAIKLGIGFDASVGERVFAEKIKELSNKTKIILDPII